MVPNGTAQGEAVNLTTSRGWIHAVNVAVVGMPPVIKSPFMTQETLWPSPLFPVVMLSKPVMPLALIIGGERSLAANASAT